MVFKNGMALSSLDARPLIVHGHVAIGARVITIPGYEVGGGEEANVRLIGREPGSEGQKISEPAEKEGAAAPPEERPAEAK